MKIPDTENFNYSSYRSGQTGGGRGDSKPESKNGAVCRAEAANDSSAWGEFQLGYCFDNAGEAPLDATVKLRVKVSETNEAKKKEGTAEGVPPMAANASLTFFIKDSNGSFLKTENLLGNSLDKGPNVSGVSHDLAFDARFEPKRGYYLMMAGRSEVQAPEGQSATVTLEVKEAALEIEWRPAASAAAPEPAHAIAANPSEGDNPAP